MSKYKKTGDSDLSIKVVNRRLACENTKFFVYLDHVIDKTGSEVSDYLVVAPKSTGKNLVAGIAILPIIDGQVGLVRIYRPALRAYVWEIPHGFVNEGEDEETSALRELLEETGLVVSPNGISSLGFITPDSGVIAARGHLYVVEAGYLTSQREHELGLGEFRFFPLREFEEMIERSEIQDSFTLAAWCKYQLLQKTRRSGGDAS